MHYFSGTDSFECSGIVYVNRGRVSDGRSYVMVRCELVDDDVRLSCTNSSSFSVFFGLSSYGKCYIIALSSRRLVLIIRYYVAIAPAFFQFASELFYPISEIIPTGYLFTVGNIGGVFLVALMGWS